MRGTTIKNEVNLSPNSKKKVFGQFLGSMNSGNRFYLLFFIGTIILLVILLFICIMSGEP